MKFALLIAGLVQLGSAFVVHLDNDVCGRSLVLKSVWDPEGGSTAVLSLDDEHTTPCYLHILVPSMHVIAMHLVPAYQLTMSLPSKLKVKNYDPRWSLAFNASDDAVLSRLEFRGHVMNNITLVWHPCNSDNCASGKPYRLVVTAVGQGKTVCHKGKVTPCKVPRRLFLTSEESCVSAELICDGYGNCPLADDEQNCITAAFSVVDSIFQDMSKHLLTNLLHRGVKMFASAAPTTTGTTTTTTPLPPISDIEKKNGDDSFPAVLSRYGPWGYLLMGMVLCTIVLMLCGLYECCCKATKATPGGSLPSTSATTTVFIISSGGIPNPVTNVTPPATPGPPSYDELDQPPSYADLFPMTKLKKTNGDDPEQPPQEEQGT